MLTVCADATNSQKISIPQNELNKLGIKDGDEIEFYKNESDEIILRPKPSDRRKNILDATREIIETRKSALIELGKGHE